MITGELKSKVDRIWDTMWSGGTDHVWFYNMQADGYSLDDKRTPQLHKSDLPDILARWQHRAAESQRKRTDPSFLVPKAEIATNDYDLSINRYQEVAYEAVEHEPPQMILARLAQLEEEIAEGRKELGEMLASTSASLSRRQPQHQPGRCQRKGNQGHLWHPEFGSFWPGHAEGLIAAANETWRNKKQ